MKNKRIQTIIGLALAVMIVLVGWAPDTALEAAEATPQEAVNEFYVWYLDYAGQRPERRNPLVDRAYHGHQLLSPAFVAEVDALLDSWTDGRHSGFDPFLLAQDIPVRVQVVDSSLSSDTAQVTVHMFWGGNPTPSERTVTLERSADGFVITGVTADR
jgi:hypothetical protein